MYSNEREKSITMWVFIEILSPAAGARTITVRNKLFLYYACGSWFIRGVSLRLAIIDTPLEMAEALRGRAMVSAEMMYRPRPTDPDRRRILDFTLESRLSELSRYGNSAVVFICNDEATVESLAHLSAQFPAVAMAATITNPVPVASSQRDPYARTPFACEWPEPERWRRYELTDRWARLIRAFEIVQLIEGDGYLALPAHDAVWGTGLLDPLIRFSKQHTRQGMPAAVSPYTPYQHSPVPGVNIPRQIINALNAAFGRDSRLREKLSAGQYQAFWGKMGLIPFAMSSAVLQHADTFVWEDDLEIDRVIREQGYGARALWIGKPALYRQAPPVLNRADLRAVIDRTLHYSLSIPGETYSSTSILRQPLDVEMQLKMQQNPRFARAVALAETLIAECTADITERVERYGASWVDWGAYRYVACVGDPVVQVWKYQATL